ncbi:hypothetical protein ACLOJK_026496, partial [Asimina triloba]
APRMSEGLKKEVVEWTFPGDGAGHIPNIEKINGNESSVESESSDYVISIEKELEKFSWVGSKKWPSCSIFKIPKGLRGIDSDSYTPKIISIGPVHRSQPHLMPMEQHKWRFLSRMLARTQRSLEDYVVPVSELKDRARDCYPLRTEDEICDKAFVQMLLLDACFIVELLLAFHHGYVSLGYPQDDPIFAARGLLKWIQRDLLLLENQIPLFVVDRVFQLTASCGSSVATLAIGFFQSAIPGYVKNPDARAASSGDIKEEELHLLGVVWRCIVPSPWLAMRSPNTAAKPDAKFYQTMLQPVSTLRDSGVKFVKKKSARLTEVEFDLERGTLYIPPLVIDDSISIFLNLTAFEQCYPHCHDEMSLYVTLLDALIDSPRDVAYLQHKGIIDNRLGSDAAVAELFNRICREIVVDPIQGSHFTDLADKMNRHLAKSWPAWKVSLKREHFRHPWSILSVAAAVILLFLTIMQVVYAMIAYHLPP